MDPRPRYERDPAFFEEQSRLADEELDAALREINVFMGYPPDAGLDYPDPGPRWEQRLRRVLHLKQKNAHLLP